MAGGGLQEDDGRRRMAGGYHPFCTDSISTSRVKVKKEKDILSFGTFPLAYSKAILPPSQVEF